MPVASENPPLMLLDLYTMIWMSLQLLPRKLCILAQHLTLECGIFYSGASEKTYIFTCTSLQLIEFAQEVKLICQFCTQHPQHKDGIFLIFISLCLG